MDQIMDIAARITCRTTGMTLWSRTQPPIQEFPARQVLRKRNVCQDPHVSCISLLLDMSNGVLFNINKNFRREER